MSYFSIEHKSSEKDYSLIPFFSIIIATYNEEESVVKRVKNCLDLDYPKEKYEIFIVDSASSDKTIENVSNFIDEYKTNVPKIQLIREHKRQGKALALQNAVNYIKGDIVLIADANSIYEKSVLREIGPLFKDENIGAVSGKYQILNQENDLASLESYYWSIENIIFEGESAIDSIVTVIGTISAWRKELVCFSSDTISEDLDMTLKVRKKGYFVKYEPRAVVFEPGAITKKDQIQQRRRTCLGTIQNTFKYLDFLLHPKNFKFSFLFFSHKILQILSPFNLILFLLSLILIRELNIIIVNIIFIFSIALLLFVVLYFNLLKKMSENNHVESISIGWIPGILHYILLNEYIILLAWKDFIVKKNSVLWDKAESTRLRG